MKQTILLAVVCATALGFPLNNGLYNGEGNVQCYTCGKGNGANNDDGPSAFDARSFQNPHAYDRAVDYNWQQPTDLESRPSVRPTHSQLNAVPHISKAKKWPYQLPTPRKVADVQPTPQAPQATDRPEVSRSQPATLPLTQPPPPPPQRQPEPNHPKISQPEPVTVAPTQPPPPPQRQPEHSQPEVARPEAVTLPPTQPPPPPQRQPEPSRPEVARPEAVTLPPTQPPPPPQRQPEPRVETTNEQKQNIFIDLSKGNGNGNGNGNNDGGGHGNFNGNLNNHGGGNGNFNGNLNGRGGDGLSLRSLF